MFRANGSKIKFEGYRKVYQSAADKARKDNILPDLAEGDTAKLQSNDPAQHFTQPPARFTEASLVKALEENGVGRPSTYAPSIRSNVVTTLN